MITLIIPAYSSGPNIERTIESARALCDEVVIISTAIYLDDGAALSKLGKVVSLPWNFVFHQGFGKLYNLGTATSKNDWQLLLGVAETVAEPYLDIHQHLKSALAGDVFRCDHVNDVNTWKRIWNRRGGSQWLGIIHEEIAPGARMREVIFRMQDTEKTPNPDPVRNEVFRFIKALSYNWLYKQLLLNPHRLGAASPWWLDFVKGARVAIESFCEEHNDMILACLESDAPKFIKLVEQRVSVGRSASCVDFKPQGT